MGAEVHSAMQSYMFSLAHVLPVGKFSTLQSVQEGCILKISSSLAVWQ